MPRSRGRYPWLTASKEYLAMRRGFIADSTVDEWKRKLHRISNVLIQLKNENEISTASPMEITRTDIAAVIRWAQESGLQPSTIEKYMMLMEKVCAFVGNPVFERLRAAGENLPRRTPKDLSSLSEEELQQIAAKAEEVRGWYGEIARFLVAIYPYSGLRPSELRRAHIEDIDTRKWRIWVRHPKGERKYAKQRYAPILPPSWNAVNRFLRAREEHLRRSGFEKATPLIPAKHGNDIGFYSSGRFREIKKMVEIPGVKLTLKTFRDTFCQMCIDRDPNLLSDTSVAMGHTTSRTTEMHYGRLKNEQALDRLQQSWLESSVKKGFIRKNDEASGQYGVRA
jgi:integrase